jgi:tRNA pseudouridine55 synthase
VSRAAARDGILLLAKPAGITSHDLVEQVRRSRLGRGRRVGHAGTLDPFATGLMLVLVGSATRVQRFLVALPKTYRATARFGATSDTGDPTGTLTRTGQRASEPDLKDALPALTGAIEQSVPLTSAVKVGGERLYKKAHRGEQVETPTRTVSIHRLELEAFDSEAQRAQLEVECSSGTYVRQLVADLGRMSGAGAYCETLERLAVGPFRLDAADESKLVPLADALSFMPERALDEAEARLVRHGGAIENGAPPAPEEPVRLTTGGELVGIGEPREGKLRPIVVLSPG